MNVVEGMIKVEIFSSNAYASKRVTLSRGSNSWEATLDAYGTAIIMIPSLPNIPNTACIARIYNNDAVVLQKTFVCGFGDWVQVKMLPGDQPVVKSQLDTTNTNVTNLTNTVNSKITYGQSDKVDGGSSLTTGTIYCYY